MFSNMKLFPFFPFEYGMLSHKWNKVPRTPYFSDEMEESALRFPFISYLLTLI